jgi:DNA polymerase (family 10)
MKLSKNITNIELAELLRAVAASYQLKDEKGNRFKIIAYQRAADAVEHLSSEAKDLWDDNKLKDVAGIGPSIAGHIDEIYRTGKSKHFEMVMKGLPPAMFKLMEVPGIGAKTAFKLVSKLKLSSLKDLEKAAKQGKISVIEGFGKDSQETILKSIGEVKRRTKRLLLPYATKLSEEIIEWLKKCKDVKQVDPLGSLRRKASTIGDIDISVATENPQKVIDHFCSYPNKTRVLEKGERTATIVVAGNRHVDLMVQSVKAYGATLQHFTGSKHHNIALREFALKKGMSLSEYGIKKKGKLKKYNNEKDFYKDLGLDLIPPEIREDQGEIDAALKHKLPKLLELKDIKADLQVHSNFNIETSHDLGESSMKEIVEKADKLGYEYIAFTEHNPSKSRHNENQIVELIKKKKDEVDKINYSLNKSKETGVKKVFNSLEIDILPNGKLPVSDRGLDLLDFAIVSIHSSFRQKRSVMTRRIIDSLAHPKSKILAHPTARKINEREGVEINWREVFEYCKKNNKWLEINADPKRLDLPDTLVKDAINEGILLTLGTDAHHKDGLENMIWGVSVARRGWVEKQNVVNTRSLEDFEKMLK